MFIGRKKELEFLESHYNSNKTEFIVLYGRRRIGKTELIKSFIKDKPAIFYTALQVTDSLQLDKFSRVLGDYFEEEEDRRPFSDWQSAFVYFAKRAKNFDKLILVIDEFPYAVESNTGIPSVLQQCLDHDFKDVPIMLIISGSSMSFMENKVLGSKNPLYGRATGIYKLEELSFEEARAFIPNHEIVEQIAYYSIFSGVPHYLSQIEDRLSLRENISNQILHTGAILFSETEFLLKQELREVSVYNAIIEAVAMGKTKLNDIAMHSGIQATKLPYYITGLTDLGIIEKEYPATVKVKARAKSKAGLYQLSNDYFRFYYRYIYPYTSEILEGSTDIVLEDIILKTLTEYTAKTFEKVSIQYLRRWNNNRQLNARYTTIGRYWLKDMEIDIVAFNPKNQYLFGECKWTLAQVGIDVFKRLEEKSGKFECTSKEFVIFSKSGFKTSLVSLAKSRDDISLIDFSGTQLQIIK